jgi:hypothetical protein
MEFGLTKTEKDARPKACSGLPGGKYSRRLQAERTATEKPVRLHNRMRWPWMLAETLRTPKKTFHSVRYANSCGRMLTAARLGPINRKPVSLRVRRVIVPSCDSATSHAMPQREHEQPKPPPMPQPIPPQSDQPEPDDDDDDGDDN